MQMDNMGKRDLAIRSEDAASEADMGVGIDTDSHRNDMRYYGGGGGYYRGGYGGGRGGYGDYDYEGGGGRDDDVGIDL
jgi:hypothetical protein